ncbi:MAG: PD-(D/E)XK nuclease family protein, partial [Phycisphaerales bacterium JB038]
MENLQRQFLGWCQPPLRHAARWLGESLGRAGLLDLSDAILVTPGARAGRTMLAMLVEAAAEASLELLPPRFCTPGVLARELLDFPRPVADATARRLAWVRSLRGLPPEQLRAIIKHPPETEEGGPWQGYAAFFERLHADLAAEGLRLSEVPALVQEAPWFEDEGRWQAAGEAQRRYLEALASWGLCDADMVRLEALANAEPIETPIVLIGVPELGKALQRLLRERCRSVTSLIIAPESEAAGFDELGCLLAEYWAERPIPLPADDIFFAEDAVAQAETVLALLAETCETHSLAQVTIGVADPAAETAIAGRLELETGLAVHRASGRPIAQMSPYRLLSAVAEFLADNRFSAFAALARHGDVEALGERLAKADGAGPASLSWAEALDVYQRETIPTRVDGAWSPAVRAEVRQALAEAHRAVQVLLGDLGAEPSERRGYADWATALRGLLQRAYAGRSANPEAPAERRLIETLRRLADELESWRQLEARAGSELATCTAAEALRFLLAQTGEARLAEESAAQALEMLGWLELPLDGAPIAMVTGMNQGCVPATQTYDPLLPGSLRSALGLPDRETRLARDTYLLTVLAETRQRLVLIAGKRTQRGDPLLPSPLLFRAEAIAAPALLLRAAGARPHTPSRRAASVLEPGAVDQFLIAPHLAAARVETMSVTSFGTYLRSPYLFYLQHVLKLRIQDDSARELDAAAFGSLLHKVLESFARGEMRESTSPEEIDRFLQEELRMRGQRLFGGRPSMPVRLQLEFAKFRLGLFA